MPYRINEVDARDPDIIAALHRFNGLAPDRFPALQERHFDNGFWWIAHLETEPVAFAGLVPHVPFDRLGVGYLKRCWVHPDHYGHGIQYRMMMARELKARQLGWKMLVSECGDDNSFSANNFRKAGFSITNPEQRWGGDPDRAIYWVKLLEKP